MREVAGQRRVALAFAGSASCWNAREIQEPQEALPAVSGGKVIGSPRAWAETGAWQPHADARAAGPRRALIDGLCLGHVRRLAQVQDLGQAWRDPEDTDGALLGRMSRGTNADLLSFSATRLLPPAKKAQEEIAEKAVFQTPIAWR
jgi:hypothetical protein